MNSEKDTARIYTRAMLRAAIRDRADHIATVSLNPDTPEACADYVYEKHGIPIDIGMLSEEKDRWFVCW